MFGPGIKKCYTEMDVRFQRPNLLAVAGMDKGEISLYMCATSSVFLSVELHQQISKNHELFGQSCESFGCGQNVLKRGVEVITHL